MLVVRSDDHHRHAPRGEIYGGELVTPFERPERWDRIVAALDDAGMTDVRPPHGEPPETLLDVHDPGYVEFLREAWSQWRAAGHDGDMIPTCFPGRRMRALIPDDIDGRLGYYSFAAETSITEGTWPAALASATIARTAQELVGAGAPAAFALCRPPGHHAAIDYFGGYCFLNNAAIAAQGFVEAGAERVAVLDVDFHHGNGTQDIFYERADVLFASLHGDPRHEFPHFSGFADEIGTGPGEGSTVNLPLPPGTSYAGWLDALRTALERIESFGAEALVVSLGVDTFVEDPISSFGLGSDDFTDYGRRLGELGLPTVYVMEGGYAVDAIGINTVNVLRGHVDGTP